jgi:hypothetical protein
MPEGSGYALKAASDGRDLSKMKLGDIARRIGRHLQRLEKDKAWNRYDGDGLSAEPRRKLYRPSARRGQRSAIVIVNISYQGGVSHPRADAVAYLVWLEAGNKGTMNEFKRQR